MRARPFNPSHLDVRSFAEHGASLEGSVPLAELPRLADSAHADNVPTEHATIEWQADGEIRTAPGGEKQPWLFLQAHATVRLTCQRCLQAVECALEVDREYRFVSEESKAAELDIDSEEDVLVESRSFDLKTLIEDELLLSLPLVPRHPGACPQPLRPPADPVAAAIELSPRDKPFAVLARLKSRKADS